MVDGQTQLSFSTQTCLQEQKDKAAQKVTICRDKDTRTGKSDMKKTLKEHKQLEHRERHPVLRTGRPTLKKV